MGVNQYAAGRSPLNWHRAEEFIPERHLPEEQGSEEFRKDQRSSLQPFSYGPRNCIGRNLAYAEMRLMLTRALWDFDFELAPGSKDWKRQKTYLLWEKQPLMVHLRPVQR